MFSGQTVGKVPVQGTVNALCWHPGRNWLAWSTGAKSAPVWYVVQQE